MTVQRVERHIIKPNNVRFRPLKDLCHNSKNLYNYVNYIIRQAFINKETIPSEYDISTNLAKENQIDYRALPAQTSKQTIRLLYKNYKSFFSALKSYQKDKSKFTSNPRLPKYKKKNGLNIAIFTNQQAKPKISNLVKIHFPKVVKIKPIITHIDFKTSSLKQVRVIPKASCFIVEIVYETEIQPIETVSGSFLSIDLGLNNFVTAIDNQSKQPFIINGRGVKSVNQLYNKLRAKYTSIAKTSNSRYSTNRLNRLTLKRETKLTDFTHKASNLIIQHCIKYKISTVVIGKNDKWKLEINLGKRTNQNFVSIPYESFINKLKYKCENCGIDFIETNESYTSKCDHLVGEDMKHHENYLGKRIKRGLFKSSSGKILNADVNGAIGIARKVFRDAVKTLTDSGAAFVPIKINISF